MDPVARSAAVDPTRNRVYLVTENDGVRMHDATTLAPLGAVHLGAGVLDVAVDPAAGLVYVSRWQVAGGRIFVLRADDLAVLHEFTQPDGFLGPHGLTADRGKGRLYVARDFRSGEPGTPTVTAMSAFDIGPDGALDHLVTHSFSPPNVQPRDVAVDEGAGLIFLGCIGANTPDAEPRLIVFSRDTLKPLGSVFLPSPVRAVATRNGSGVAYVAGEAGLMFVDGRTFAHLLTVPLGPQPTSVAVDQETGVAYVGDNTDGILRRIDLPSGV